LAADQREEFVVVAEYEKGRSAPSRPAYTHLAVVVPADAVRRITPQAEPGAKGPHPQAAVTPFFEAPVRPGRGLLVGRGQLDAKVDIGYELERVVSNGWGYIYDPVNHSGTMPFGVVDWKNYDSTKLYYWEQVDSRTTLSVPLTVRYGLLDAVELGVVGAWHSETAIFERASVGGNDYNMTINSPEMHTSALADTTLFAHLQPVADWPWLMAAEVTLPTGKSRFDAYATYWTQSALGVTPTQEAGTGEGVMRFALRTQWGWKALKPGMFFEAGYTPSASEDDTLTVAGIQVTHHADYGEIWEGGLGYTLPWQVVSGQGALVVGATGRSIKAGRWTVDGNSIYAPTDTYDAGQVHNFAGLNLETNNELEVYAQVEQDLSRYLGTNCKAYWRNESDGYSFGICGGVVY
jgi:hypothetical protein